MELKDTGTFEKRCKRYNISGHGHELTFSCFRRLPLLKNPTFCDYLAEAVRAAQHTHRFDVWAYVFMPEHLHLLIYPTQEANPVKRGLVQWPQQWYYSSYRQMHGQGDGPLDICLNHFTRR